jgi:hypothetical protein
MRRKPINPALRPCGIPTALRAFREARGLSRRQACQPYKYGLSEFNLFKVERAGAEVRFEQVYHLCKVYDISLELVAYLAFSTEPNERLDLELKNLIL